MLFFLAVVGAAAACARGVRALRSGSPARPYLFWQTVMFEDMDLECRRRDLEASRGQAEPWIFRR